MKNYIFKPVKSYILKSVLTLSGTKKGGMSDEWAKALQQAVENGEITENTARQYQQG